MSTRIARAAAGALSLAFAGLAQAVPMYFDFTGTIEGTDAPVSGGFNFETDRLSPLGPNGNQYDYVDWQPTDLTEPLAFLSFGNQSVSLPQYTVNYGLVAFIEGCTDNCGSGFGEFFHVGAFTNDILPPDGTGTVRAGMISIAAFGQTPLPDYPYWSGFDYFDGATATPADIVDLPLYYLSGIYDETVATCEANQCTNSNTQVRFSIDTVTRGFGPRSVPEPGTLTLFVAALAGLFFVRRRTTSVSIR